MTRACAVVPYRFDQIVRDTRVTVRQDEFGQRAATREYAEGWARTLNLLRDHLTCADGRGADGAEAAA
jgi:hypothetical protein